MENLLNQKLNEKKVEVEENVSYYSSREAEYETKIDELMTRLQVGGRSQYTKQSSQTAGCWTRSKKL